MVNKDAQNTRRATKTWIKCFNDYIREKKIANIIDEITTTDLLNVLFKFYSEVHPVKKDESDQENIDDRCVNSTLRCMTAGINRYIKDTR